MREEAKKRTIELIGEDKAKVLEQKKVIIFGIGGVGGYAAEAIARAGIGNITLVDGDVVSESNINRQIVADYETLGKYKVHVMRDRIKRINPECNVVGYNHFYGVDQWEEPNFEEYDYAVDAVDMVSAKIKIIEESKKAGIPVISSMGTGNKLSAEGFVVSDISKTSVCPLARVMRRELKKRDIRDVKVVYSQEKPLKTEENHPASISFVPPVSGMIMAGEVIKDLATISEDNLARE